MARLLAPSDAARVPGTRDAAIVGMHRGMHRVCLMGAVATVLAACVGGRTDVGVVDASVDAGVCPSSSQTFTLKAAGAYCVGAPSSCTTDWLTVLDANGEELVDRPCTADCADCQPVACPAICAQPMRVGAAGIARTWDGTYYAPRTCGAGVACVAPGCMAAGHYVAKMCAYVDATPNAASCSPVGPPVCARVAFDWPGAPVTGLVGGDAH